MLEYLSLLVAIHPNPRTIEYSRNGYHNNTTPNPANVSFIFILFPKLTQLNVFSKIVLIHYDHQEMLLNSQIIFLI